jgi:hypothetical protein
MGNATEALQKMREEFEQENESRTVHTQVRLLENPSTISDRRQNGEIARSSVVCVVQGSKAPHGLVRKGINAADVRYRVEKYTNVGPHR